VALWQLLTGVCRPTYVAQDWLPSDQVVARFGPLARTSSIHAHAQVGEGTQIGGAVVIHAGVRIGQGCTIGSGVVLGDHGFGIVKLPQSAQILPHWAGLEIEDQVWIGPQTHVAAGLLEPTRIGAGCFLDAQIQIGHNCQLGKGCVLAAQVGISGSVHLGDFCEVGGQAGFADHVRLGERCRVAARAGVTRSWPAGSVLGGFPAEPIAQWRKRMVRERTPKEQGKFPI
jgi:UDP-3-O-[3-hydroxymyristoyl] glucosamine N-acyltransferase